MAKKHKPRILRRDFNNTSAPTNPAKPQTGIRQERVIGFEVREINEEKRTVRVSFSSEQAVNRFWGSEILCHDEGCVDLARLKEMGVSLFNHDRNVVIGVPQNPILNSVEKRCYADIYFDDDSDSDKIFQKVKKGILRGVSVGYSVDTWEEVAAGKKSANGRFTGPCYIATKWTPFEVSIVSVPADDSVGVNRENEVNNSVHSTERETNMEKLCRSLSLDYAALTAQGFTDEQIRAMCSALQQRAEADGDDEAAKKKAAKEAEDEEEKGKKSAIEQEKRELVSGESQRAVEIATICRDFEVDAIPYIKEGKSVDDVRAAVLNKVKQERTAIPGDNPNVVIVAAEQDKFRSAVTDGLLMRGGVTVEKPAGGANDFRGIKLRDLAVECLAREGVQNAHRLDDSELFKRAVTPDSQFVSIMDNTVGKSMATAYKAAPTTYEQWTSKSSNPDFKAAPIYQISEAGDLVPMTQSGEFKFDEMKDSKVTKKVLTYGRSFGMSRQSLINDDIGILTRIPQSYVRAALRGRNRLVYKVLGENKAIYDGKPLFHAQHNNLAATGAVLSTETLAQARKAMRKQKNLKGNETLNISAAFLLVPTDLEVAAAQLLRSMSDPSQTNPNVVNVFQNAMTIIVDAELDNYDEKSYYFAANPADCDTIGVTYLNGNEQPQLESQVGFDFLGIKWRIFDDFGVDAFDHRGLFKNPGA